MAWCRTPPGLPRLYRSACRESREADQGEVEEALPEPGVAEEAPDAEAAVEAQESGGWFGRLRQGLRRSRESVVGQLNAAVAEFRDAEGDELRELLIEHATRMLEGPVELDVSHEPTVILMVGVNGTGKTTTIGKLVNFLPGKAMLAAGDTFRAAAIEQLQRWGERTGAPVVARERGADAAAVAHEAVEAAKRDEVDVLLVGTAGAPHTPVNPIFRIFLT